MKYPKIETLYNRDPDDRKHVIVGEFRDPAFGLVDRWLVTEKVDGTNVRVFYEDGAVRFGGRTDNAQMPPFLLDTLHKMFSAERFASVWPSAPSDVTVCDQHPRVILYGEGYGLKIQKDGGGYRSDSSFRLFDVAVQDVNEEWWWLDWPNVENVADKLGINTVPVLAENATLKAAIDMTRKLSVVALLEGDGAIYQEGIVCRTVPYLFTQNGARLMWKLKDRDLKC